MQLNRRLQKILETLLNNDYTKLEKIMKSLNVSKRTAYYDISKINEYLQKSGIEITNIKNLGYHINASDKDDIKKLLKYSTNDYILSPKERSIKIIIDLLTGSQKSTIEKYSDNLYVSRNTILGDIKEVKKYITKYNLTLNTQGGYKLEGKEKEKRYLFINIYNEYGYLFYQHEIIEEYKNIKNQIEKLNLNILKHNNLKYILMYLTMFYKYYYKNNMNCFQKEDIQFLQSQTSNKEAKILLNSIKKSIAKEIDDTEIYYIQTFLVSDQDIRKFFNKQNLKHQYISSVKMMVKEFEKISCISIDDYETLEKDILNHLTPSLFRTKYGVYYPNIVKNEIKKKYKSVYQFTKQAIKHIDNLMDMFLNEDEIAYVSMYFGGYTSKMGVEIKIPKIVIVCNFGMATSQLLKNQIQELFDLIEIEDILSLENFKQYTKYYDFAISTVDIDEDTSKFIKVSPVLTDLDKKNLVSQISNAQSTFNKEQETIDKIMTSIERHTTISDKEKLREEIKTIMINSREKSKIQKATLKELLYENTITLNQEANDWKEAISIASQSLIKLGYIENSYVNACIDNVAQLGPYIVIAQNVAMPHANPENGVNKLGMSITTFKNKIKFSNNEKHNVKMIVTLAPKDQQSHIKALACLTQMLRDKDNIETIINAKDKNLVLKLINKYSR
ncbi:MAG: BglG family transcription antiterminator [Terrisporobacter sp.]